MSELPHGPVAVIGLAYNMFWRSRSVSMGEHTYENVGDKEDEQRNPEEAHGAGDKADRHRELA